MTLATPPAVKIAAPLLGLSSGPTARVVAKVPFPLVRSRRLVALTSLVPKGLTLRTTAWFPGRLLPTGPTAPLGPPTSRPTDALTEATRVASGVPSGYLWGIYISTFFVKLLTKKSSLDLSQNGAVSGAVLTHILPIAPHFIVHIIHAILPL